ncbi:MAG: GGDEF domain-containing protein [Deltaproteobacteria bacterium]
MEYKDLLHFLQHVGTDPSRLIFEDELTGIYNRRFLLNYFRYKVPWDSLENRHLSLLMMDLDRFKEINDNYGHDAGDQVLIWVASLIKEVAGDQGLAIRYAGDEFIILLAETDAEQAEEISRRIRNSIYNTTLDYQGRMIRASASLGMAVYPRDASEYRELIAAADREMYANKEVNRSPGPA